MNLNYHKIEDILKEEGAIRFDNKCIRDHQVLFNVKEFIFVFFGSSQDKKSRAIANALNVYAEFFNPEDMGLSREKDEIVAKSRNC